LRALKGGKPEAWGLEIGSFLPLFAGSGINPVFNICSLFKKEIGREFLILAWVDDQNPSL
jgi:hypothetical protein